ncbi:ECF transporter S component, partial [Bifidobacterium sp.]
MNQSVMPSRHRFRWSVADITVTAVIAVASGIVFWAIGFIYAPIGSVLDIVPGASDLLNGFYYIAGPLAMVIVRKP